MRQRRSRPLAMFAVLAAALAVALGLIAAGPAGLIGAPASARAATGSTGSHGSTFTTTLETEVSTLNPFLAYFLGETETLQVIYPTLTRGNDQNQPEAYLARSWSVSADKKTWTFHLQPGLKWSDGVALTAADVAWTYELMLHNATAATANGQLLTNFRSVTAPNATTVVITTKSPQANMLSLVAVPPIVPEHIWASKVKNLGSFTNTQAPIVGYGPYELTGYASNQYETLTANPDFFLQKPTYRTLILDYVASTDGAVTALRNGSLDATDFLTATEFNALRHTPGITAYEQQSNTWEAVELNPGARTRSGTHIGDGNPALENPLVRRAVAEAINRQVLVQKIWDGYAQPGSAYLTPAYPEWKWSPSAAEAESYSPATAESLLTRAGYRMGSGGFRVDPRTHKTLTLRLGIHNDYPADAQIASYLSGWLEAVGIKVDIQAMSTTQLNNNLAVGNWDMLMDQWNTVEDPTSLLSIQTCAVLPTNASGANGDTDSFFCNPRYDQLFHAEQTAFSPRQRAADVDAMQRILYNENNDIILFYNNILSAARTSYVKGYRYGSPDSAGIYPLQNEQLGWVQAIPAAASSSSSSTTVIVVVVIVVVLLLLGGGGLFWRRRAGVEDRE